MSASAGALQCLLGACCAGAAFSFIYFSRKCVLGAAWLVGVALHHASRHTHFHAGVRVAVCKSRSVLACIFRVSILVTCNENICHTANAPFPWHPPVSKDNGFKALFGPLLKSQHLWHVFAQADVTAAP